MRVRKLLRRSLNHLSHARQYTATLAGMRPLLSLLFLAAMVKAQNGSQLARIGQGRTSYKLSLPQHAGRVHFDAPTFLITEASAKPNGQEFGLGGDNAAGDVHLIAYLFILPHEPPLTSERCRDSILHDEGFKFQGSLGSNSTGVAGPVAVAQYDDPTGARTRTRCSCLRCRGRSVCGHRVLQPARRPNHARYS
jgi:hypothetical protein